MVFYDRSGEPIDVAAADDLLGDDDYRRVAWEQVGRFTVSTAWMGVDLSFGLARAPLIFETMILEPGPLHGIYRRYPSEAAALAGHRAAVEVCRLEMILDGPTTA